MKIRLNIFLILCIAAAYLYGCGVGGFVGASTTPSPTSPDSASTQRIYGVAAAGLFNMGQIKVFQMNTDGSKRLLKTATTDAFANYSSSITLTGPVVLVEASGNYTDEATGNVLTVNANSPLRAATGQISNVMKIAVTPLTELAVRNAETQDVTRMLSDTNTTSANALVSSIFKIDILADQPRQLTRAEFGDVRTSQSAKDYSLALAAMSQMTHDNYDDSLSGALADISKDINALGILSAANAAKFKTALGAFLNSPQNHTGVSDINLTNLVNAGGGVKAFKLVAEGALDAGTTICGVRLVLRLPANVTIRADFSGGIVPLSGIVAESGGAPSGTVVVTSYTPANGTNPASLTLALAHQTGFGLGEFATVLSDIPAGASVQPGDFTVTEFEAVDKNGVALPSLSVGVQ